MAKRETSEPPLTDTEEAEIQAAIARDPDNPELTDEQLAGMQSASDVLPPALYEALTARKPDACP